MFVQKMVLAALCYFVLTLIFVVQLSAATCPPSYPSSCSCNTKTKGIFCAKNDRITEIPRGLFANDTKILSFRQTKIGKIRREDFKNLTQLEDLSIVEGPLHSIEAGAFQPLRNLVSLSLVRNALETKNIPNDTFHNLARLQKVQLDINSGITIFPVGMFKDSPAINTLGLGGTGISRLTNQEFNGLRNLKDINLFNCKIKYIEKDFLKGTKVTHVNIYGNPIVKIDKDAMRGDQIVDFSSQYCGLTDDKVFGEESFFLQMTSLNRLNLGHNNLSHIPKNAFQGMAKLKALLLFYNNISTIEENPFVSLPKDVSMAFQNNPFKCDCHLAWFDDLAAKQLDSAVVKYMLCDSPPNLKGKSFNLLKKSDFCCNATAKTPAICGIPPTKSNGQSTTIHPTIASGQSCIVLGRCAISSLLFFIFMLIL